MRMVDYLVREGLEGTMRRIRERVSAKMGGASARTTFLFMKSAPEQWHVSPPMEIRAMCDGDRKAFEAFNFFPHIDGDSYLERPDRGVILCLDEGRIVGYACYEVGGMKDIHGTGQFWLESDEAWIGPCYVERACRGRGINGAMISQAVVAAATSGATSFYTAINSANAASLASFKKIDFVPFAEYDAKRHSQRVVDTLVGAKLIGKIKI